MHGVTGSGKTHLATRLGRLTGIGWTEVDSIARLLRWHFRSFCSKHDGLVAWEADPEQPPVLRLPTPCELERRLGTVATERERSA